MKIIKINKIKISDKWIASITVGIYRYTVFHFSLSKNDEIRKTVYFFVDFLMYIDSGQHNDRETGKDKYTVQLGFYYGRGPPSEV